MDDLKKYFLRIANDKHLGLTCTFHSLFLDSTETHAGVQYKITHSRRQKCSNDTINLRQRMTNNFIVIDKLGDHIVFDFKTFHANWGRNQVVSSRKRLVTYKASRQKERIDMMDRQEFHYSLQSFFVRKKDNISFCLSSWRSLLKRNIEANIPVYQSCHCFINFLKEDLADTDTGCFC